MVIYRWPDWWDTKQSLMCIPKTHLLTQSTQCPVNWSICLRGHLFRGAEMSSSTRWNFLDMTNITTLESANKHVHLKPRNKTVTENRLPYFFFCRTNVLFIATKNLNKHEAHRTLENWPANFADVLNENMVKCSKQSNVTSNKAQILVFSYELRVDCCTKREKYLLFCDRNAEAIQLRSAIVRVRTGASV